MVLETLIENGLLRDIFITLSAVLDHIEDDTVSGRKIYDKCADLQVKLYNQIYSKDRLKLVQCGIDGKAHVLVQYINSEEEEK